jgi:hypothetical protein
MQNSERHTKVLNIGIEVLLFLPPFTAGLESLREAVRLFAIALLVDGKRWSQKPPKVPTFVFWRSLPHNEKLRSVIGVLFAFIGSDAFVVPPQVTLTFGFLPHGLFSLFRYDLVWA